VGPPFQAPSLTRPPSSSEAPTAPSSQRSKTARQNRMFAASPADPARAHLARGLEQRTPGDRVDRSSPEGRTSPAAVGRSKSAPAPCCSCSVGADLSHPARAGSRLCVLLLWISGRPERQSAAECSTARIDKLASVPHRVSRSHVYGRRRKRGTAGLPCHWYVHSGCSRRAITASSLSVVRPLRVQLLAGGTASPLGCPARKRLGGRFGRMGSR
jgi:hypothetical protein